MIDLFSDRCSCFDRPIKFATCTSGLLSTSPSWAAIVVRKTNAMGIYQRPIPTLGTLTLPVFRTFIKCRLFIHTSNNSPCSSGYATPQQTALTDSMVDTLPWKSLSVKEDGRNIMEDSTDTLVDDGNKASCC